MIYNIMYTIHIHCVYYIVYTTVHYTVYSNINYTVYSIYCIVYMIYIYICNTFKKVY